jgi:hypothetical protein
MATRAEFIRRQHDEVRETLEKLRQHAAAFEEKIQEGGDAEKWGPLAAEAKAGIAALEPVLEDFDTAGVDPEELVKYAQTIEDWQRKEPDLAAKLS